jgi:hypothetical protein
VTYSADVAEAYPCDAGSGHCLYWFEVRGGIERITG